MKTKYINNAFSFLIFSTIVANFSLYLSMQTHPILGAVINYFSYFTVLSNFFLAVTSTQLFRDKINENTPWRQAFRVSSVISIIITGLVFNILLRPIFHPTTLTARITNELYHSFIPVVAFLLWLWQDKRIFISKALLLRAFALPILYLPYIFIRGFLTHVYPYYFLNIDKIGLTKVSFMVVFVMGLFFMIGFLLKLIRKIKMKEKTF